MVAPPGHEEITRAELFNLGINHPRAVVGGVEFSGFLTHLYRVNLWSRTASRVLVRLGEFEAVNFAELRRKTAALPWGDFLKPGTAVSVRATCHKSKLYHSDAVAERVAAAVVDHFGREPMPTLPAAEVVTLIERDYCTISLNASGDHLHRRGYRLAAAKAPLRETLAADLLMRAAYTPNAPLLDPFCGSGTFAIEAALMARNIAPGVRRPFAFFNWVDFDQDEWNGLTLQANGEATVTPLIVGSDRDAGAIEAATANAHRAAVADAIQFSVRAISAIEPPAAPGLIVANLPYGERLGDDVRDLYAQFGNVLRATCRGWRVAALCANKSLAQAIGLPFESVTAINNGGIQTSFVQGLVG